MLYLIRGKKEVYINLISFTVNAQPLQTQLNEQYGMSQCPDNPAQIISECGDSVSCLYDNTMLNARILGLEAQNTWNTFTAERIDATRQCL